MAPACPAEEQTAGVEGDLVGAWDSAGSWLALVPRPGTEAVESLLVAKVELGTVPLIAAEGYMAEQDTEHTAAGDILVVSACVDQARLGHPASRSETWVRAVVVVGLGTDMEEAALEAEHGRVQRRLEAVAIGWASSYQQAMVAFCVERRVIDQP